MWIPISSFERPSSWRKQSSPERDGNEKRDGRLYWGSTRKNRELRCEIPTTGSRTSITPEQVHEDQTALRTTEWTVIIQIIRPHNFVTCAHFFISRVLVLEDEQQQQEQQESRVKRSGPITQPRGIATELRTMKPLPKRRASRRTRSNSPPPIYDKLEVKRPRLSDGTR